MPPRTDEAAAEKEKIATWLLAALVSNPFATNYFAEGVKVIHCHTKTHSKSVFLKALSNISVQQPILARSTIEVGVKPPGLLSSKAGQRFDYENVNLLA